MNDIVNKNLGHATAYGYAKAGGYTGTEEEFEQLLGNVADILNEFENFSATAETLAAGSSATASYEDGLLSLGIPKGDKGDTGNGIQSIVLNDNYTLTITYTEGDPVTLGPIRGATGATPDISIGTVTTLNAGEDATASIAGTAEEPVLSLGIPKGPSGNTDVTAPLFSSATAYAAGDYVMYNDNLYVFTAAHTAGAWTGTDASQVTVGEELTDLKEDLTAIAIRPTVSGSIASFTDGAEDVPMKSLVVNIEPVQSGSGDPSPSNVRPISGWTGVNTARCGVNIWDEEWEVGGINSANGQPSAATDRIRSKNFCQCMPSTRYYVKNTAYPSTAAYVWYYDKNKDFISGAGANNAFADSPQNAYYFKISTYGGNYTTYNSDISVNYPSTDTAYHSGADNEQYTTALGQTVYGGKLDVVSGELVIDTATTRIASFVGKSGDSNVDMGYTTAYNNVIDSTGLSRGLPPANFKCNIAKTVALEGNPSIQHGDYDSEVVFTVDYISAAEVRISFPKSMGLDTLAKLNQYLTDNEVYFSYRTKTKTTVQLTPQEVTTLLADNNVFANAGTVNVTYCADGKLYIDNRIAELQALILEQ